MHELRVHQVELETQNEELRASRLETERLLERYTELFEFAPIGFFRLDTAGTIVEANFAGARLLGRERGKLTGETFASFVSSAHLASFARFLGSVLTRGDEPQGQVGELFLYVAGTGELRVRLTGAIIGGLGPKASALIAAEDITARWQAEEALREEARHKDQFLAALSHELRNPLAPIRNALSLLRQLPAGAERARSALVVIDRQVAHLTRIVDDLLDVTRISWGKIALHEERLDLGDLVRRAVDDHRTSFEESGIRLRLEAAPTPFWVNGDPSRLLQVVGNLLGNALKFTDRGGEVVVALRGDQGHVQLRVKDSGVGIAPDVAGHLFVPFSQGPQTLDRARGGLGLGLATAKGLVDLHRGTIEMSSRGSGLGSEFVVRLPLAPPPPDPAFPSAHSHVRPQRILVIEDNEDAASTLKDVLEFEGHVVRLAADGQSGLALARNFQPEVVLCDIGLPGMSGYEVAHAFRSEEALHKAWLVALSGYAQPEDAQRAREWGFDRHVAKPATPEMLERVLSEAATRPG
ncbi:MAG TPA: ATP-binding protein [Anaeromyxobacter sp.]|nr:ATP-binding protein [Anaeromyxobacter sp.]